MADYTMPKDGQAGTAKSQKTAQYAELEKRLGSYSGDLDLPLCMTCSTQTTWSDEKNISLEAEDTDYKCKICEDPRQFIGVHGQKWTSLRRLIDDKETGYENVFEELIPGELWAFKTQPSFGIGQRAFLIKDPAVEGLVMWDCIAYLDDATLAKIDELSDGEGIRHLVVSHPHYLSTTKTWIAAFPQMQMWFAKQDFLDWCQREDVLQAVQQQDSKNSVASRIRLVDEERTSIADGAPFTILLLGGHFPGSLVLLWKDNLLIADTIQVVLSGMYNSSEPQKPGVASVTFLWSYPNQIPLSSKEISRVCKPLEKVSFNKAFGAFEGFNIWGHAKEKIFQSRDIHIRRQAAE